MVLKLLSEGRALVVDPIDLAIDNQTTCLGCSRCSMGAVRARSFYIAPPSFSVIFEAPIAYISKYTGLLLVIIEGLS